MNNKLNPARLLEITRRVEALIEDYRHQIEEGTNRTLSDAELIPIDVEAIARSLGLEVELVERIYEGEGIRGSLNSSRLTVADGSVAIGTLRFTMAHEIGHHVVHGSGNYLRTTRESQLRRHADQLQELEAETFSALLLMPEQAVRSHFQGRFRGSIQRNRLDEATAFFLGQGTGKKLNTLDLRRMEALELAKLLARALSFGGPPFERLFKAFGVSISAMAIRLIDLKLVS